MSNVGIEYPARGEVSFYDLGEPPEPSPTEVVIRTRYSGVTNGTERHSLLGEHGWSGHFPSRNGYQAVGQIEAAGCDVKDFATGDWVFYGHYVGHRGWHVQDVGGAAAVNGSHLCLPLPDGARAKEYALLGVMGVAMRGVRRFRIAPGQNVWVAGQGPIGHFAAQAARAVGAHVTISETDQRRLEIARECGAHRTIDARDPDAWGQIEKSGPYDCIIDACGLDSLLLDLHKYNVLAIGGVVGVLAVHSNITFNWSLLHMREASIEVSCHFSLSDLRVLLHFIETGIIHVQPAITHFVPVDEAPSIYAALRDRPSELLGVVFDWNESKQGNYERRSGA